MPSFRGLELVASSLLLRLRLPSSPLEVGVDVPLSLTLPPVSLMRLWWGCSAPPTHRGKKNRDDHSKKQSRESNLCDQQRPLAPFIGKKVVAQTEGNLSDASQEKKIIAWVVFDSKKKQQTLDIRLFCSEWWIGFNMCVAKKARESI